MDEIIYREIEVGEEKTVCALVRQVFNEFLAADYGEAGTEEFFSFANPVEMGKRVKAGGSVFVASASDGLVGMLEFVPPDRIAMLFVTLRQRGIAKELLSLAIDRARSASPAASKLTVHSSPYAEPIYRKMGFERVGDATVEHGITYVPMERNLRSVDRAPGPRRLR